MSQYTKCADPSESAARKEKLRIAEEQGVLETSAAQMVRNREAREREVDSDTPDRTPATLRLGPIIPVDDPRTDEQNVLAES